MSNLAITHMFFANNPDDLVAAIEDPEWVAHARSGLAQMLTPDCEFIPVSQPVGMSEPQRGVEGFLEAYRIYADMWASYQVRPQRFTEHGDKVLVEGKIAGITRHDGVWLEQDVAAVYTFENGKIRRIEEFSDLPSANEAARS